MWYRADIRSQSILAALPRPLHHEVSTIGFEDFGNSDTYLKLNQGDNALVKISQLDPEPTEYQGEEGFQLAMEFDAVKESDRSERGTIPGWVRSKITISDSDEHTSDLGKMLQAAGVLRDVLEDLGADHDTVSAVLDGDRRFVAENDEENAEVAKAVANNLSGVVLRVGTTQNQSGDYSKVDKVYSTSDEDPFDDSGEEDDASSDEGSGSDESGDDEEEVLFSEDDDEESEED